MKNEIHMREKALVVIDESQYIEYMLEKRGVYKKKLDGC
jgi:hypothetical protein